MVADVFGKVLSVPPSLAGLAGEATPLQACHALQPLLNPRYPSAYYLRINGTTQCMKLWTKLDSKSTSALQANIATNMP